MMFIKIRAYYPNFSLGYGFYYLKADPKGLDNALVELEGSEWLGWRSFDAHMKNPLGIILN